MVRSVGGVGRRRRPATRNGRAVLDLDAIADATLACIADGGVAATTTAAIAERLGVTPRALYHYVESREEMLRLAVRRWLRLAPVLTGNDPVAALDRYIDAARDHIARYRSITDIGAAEGVVDYHESFYRQQEVALATITGWGLAPREAMLVLIDLVRLCNSLAQYYGASDGSAQLWDSDTVMQQGLDTIGADYPLTAAAGLVPADEQVDFAKRRFVDGVLAYLRAPASSNQPR